MHLQDAFFPVWLAGVGRMYDKSPQAGPSTVSHTAQGEQRASDWHRCVRKLYCWSVRADRDVCEPRLDSHGQGQVPSPALQHLRSMWGNMCQQPCQLQTANMQLAFLRRHQTPLILLRTGTYRPPPPQGPPPHPPPLHTGLSTFHPPPRVLGEGGRGGSAPYAALGRVVLGSMRVLWVMPNRGTSPRMKGQLTFKPKSVAGV